MMAESDSNEALIKHVTGDEVREGEILISQQGCDDSQVVIFTFDSSASSHDNHTSYDRCPQQTKCDTVTFENDANITNDNNDMNSSPASRKTNRTVPLEPETKLRFSTDFGDAQLFVCSRESENATNAPVSDTDTTPGACGNDYETTEYRQCNDTNVESDEDLYRQAGYFNLDRPGTPIPSGYAPDPSVNYQVSSLASSSDILPVCRICQQHEEDNDHLFAPCRCAGSLQYIHHSCLLRWIEICTKKSRKPPTCEICEYQFHRHKTFKLKRWKCPKVSNKDKCLHFIFIINLIVMIGCATATVMCFLSDKGHISKFPQNKMHLSTEEIVTLSCGVLFFVSFFVAMSVEIKAKHTIYKLLMKFFMINLTWEIEEYDKRRDIEETLLFKKRSNCG